MLETPRQRAAAAIAILGSAIALALLPFSSGLLGAAVLYVLTAEGHARLARLTRPGIAALATLLAAVIVIALPLAWVIAIVIDQAPQTVRTIQESDIFARLSQLRIGHLEVGAEVAKASGTIVRWLSTQALALVGSAATASVNVVIAFFGLYYLLSSGGNLWQQFREYIPFSARTAEALREHFFSVTRATLIGTLLTALAQGTIVGLAFLLVSLPNPLFWGTITAFVSVLPVLGSGLVWIPAVLILLLQGRPGAAVVMLIAGWLVASNVDNLIRPVVYRRVSNIHPMITLVGAFAGIKYFGLPGLLLGPLAIAYFFELLRFYKLEYGTDTPSPSDTAALSHDRGA
ncbi:MAG TPA: AI-2E family transporter [Gemmatimonadaceae bacterium]|nr:AI-2E family transporter [Gemmatimonadaceae bacterium]